MKNSFKIVASLGLAAALSSGVAFARDNDHDRGKDRAEHRPAVHRDRDHDRDRGRREIRERHENRERREARERQWRQQHSQNAMFGNNRRPSGWSHGRKTGWKNCDVPPSQARKAGCTPAQVQYAQSHRGQDRDHDGDRH